MGLFGAKTQTAEAPVIESARPLESLRAAAEALLGAGKVAGDQAPILADLILEAAVQQGASDVHLETHGDKLRAAHRGGPGRG